MVTDTGIDIENVTALLRHTVEGTVLGHPLMLKEDVIHRFVQVSGPFLEVHSLATKRIFTILLVLTKFVTVSQVVRKASVPRYCY